MQIDGACHCGAITFTAEIDPARVVACHCSDCQVLSGAPFRSVVMVPREQFQLSGAPKRYVKVAQSGNRRAQVFCPECGTPLYSTDADRTAGIVVRLGCVAQRAELAPRLQTWHRSALPWLDDLAAVPSVPESSAPPRPAAPW